jgi:NDP-sugar pyrophosphorylase family protein
MKLVKQAMVLAAGHGTRLAPFTSIIPKPLLPVFGVSVLEIVISQLITFGIQRIAINAHAHVDEMKSMYQHLQNLYPKVEFYLSIESTLMGSGGGVAHALSFFDLSQPILVTNADNVFDLDLVALESVFLSAKALVTLYCLHNVSMYYYRQVLIDQDNYITGFKDLSLKTPFFSGVYIIDPIVFKLFSVVNIVVDVFEKLIPEKKITAFLGSGFWEDMGTPELWFKIHFTLMEYLDKKESSFLKEIILKYNYKIVDGIWGVKGITVGDSVKPPCYSAFSVDSVGPFVVNYGSSIQKNAKHLLCWKQISITI